MKRNRLWSLAGLGVAALFGLWSRSGAAVRLPGPVTEYAGDICWAAGLYFLLCLMMPRASIRTLLAAALGISLAVEVSQLYRADWLNAIRSTRIGGLALGYGFRWSDLLCYAAGGLLAAAADRLLYGARPARHRAIPGRP